MVVVVVMSVDVRLAALLACVVCFLLSLVYLLLTFW